MNRIARSIAVIGVGILALTGCGLQPATAYVPRVSPGSITPLDLPRGVSLTITSNRSGSTSTMQQVSNPTPYAPRLPP